MKNFILCLFLAFTSLVPAFANAGYETHGGDAICAEFMEAFDAIIGNLNNSDLNAIERAVVDALVAKRKIVQLSSKPELFLDGVEKDAINYSGEGLPKIEISQKSWARLTKEQKDILVLHEMLPIAGFNDQDYSISLDLYKAAYGNDQDSTNNLIAIQECNIEKIKKLTTADLQPIAREDLEGWAIAHNCVPAIEVLVTANWNFNMCNVLGETGLARAYSQLKYEKIRLGTGANYVRSDAVAVQNIQTIIKMIQQHGGTMECNGHYDPPKRRF